MTPGPHADLDLLRQLASQAFARSAGAPLIAGNAVQPLFDAEPHYAALEALIAGARQRIDVEMYIFAPDRSGRQMVEALAARARAGVPVRVLVDWFGSLAALRAGLFRPLLDAGAQVRAMNAPALGKGLGFLSRDHRKLFIADNAVAVVTGLCISDAWRGDFWKPAAERRLQPWRDTGVSVCGPAVSALSDAFESSWVGAGGTALPALPSAEPAGDCDLRIIATTPQTANLLRLDLLVCALARQRLWLTDAYFVGTATYLQALQNAARDGVDVRLLIPRHSDLPLVGGASRLQYRALLEAGVRVYEWNGPMIHAKTAVADDNWARIGSTNLNPLSWLGNWELDVAIEDPHTVDALAQRYEQDLEQATEVLLSLRRRPVLARERPAVERPLPSLRGSGGRAARQAVHYGTVVRAALSGRRHVADAESSALWAAGLLLCLLAALVWWWPQLLAWPLAALGGWVGLLLIGRAAGSAWRRRRGQRSPAASAD